MSYPNENNTLHIINMVLADDLSMSKRKTEYTKAATSRVTNMYLQVVSIISLLLLSNCI